MKLSSVKSVRVALMTTELKQYHDVMCLISGPLFFSVSQYEALQAIFPRIGGPSRHVSFLTQEPMECVPHAILIKASPNVLLV